MNYRMMNYMNSRNMDLTHTPEERALAAWAKERNEKKAKIAAMLHDLNGWNVVLWSTMYDLSRSVALDEAYETITREYTREAEYQETVAACDETNGLIAGMH